jgi:ABC-2 type transport system ATP-binding protein
MIQISHLWKLFRHCDAVRDVSLTVPEGSAFALIGANGAGKTTTIKVLMNIIGPTRGRATVLGVDSRRLSPRELAQIGYVSENQDLPEKLTVGEFLAYLRPFYPTWDRALEQSILARLRLPLERKIGHLSHGMRMKMSLACALPFHPKLLVLDEPFSGLDPLVRDEFMERLLEHAGEMTIFISSHELGEIDGAATHVGFMDEGRLLFQESMSDLVARFREVHVTFAWDRERSHIDDGDPIGAALFPPRWLGVRTVGNVLSFVDSQFSEDAMGEQLRILPGHVKTVDAQPMSLRSIFTTLARAARERVLQ